MIWALQFATIANSAIGGFIMSMVHSDKMS